MKNLAFRNLLRWKMIILYQFTQLTWYIFLWENVLCELGSWIRLSQAYYAKKSKDDASKYAKNLKKIKETDDIKKQQEQQQSSLLEMMKLQMKEAQERADAQLQNALERAQSPSSVATDPEIYELRDEVDKLENKVEDLMTEVEDKEVENRRLGQQESLPAPSISALHPTSSLLPSHSFSSMLAMPPPLATTITIPQHQCYQHYLLHFRHGCHHHDYRHHPAFSKIFWRVGYLLEGVIIIIIIIIITITTIIIGMIITIIIIISTTTTIIIITSTTMIIRYTYCVAAAEVGDLSEQLDGERKRIQQVCTESRKALVNIQCRLSKRNPKPVLSVLQMEQFHSKTATLLA